MEEQIGEQGVSTGESGQVTGGGGLSGGLENIDRPEDWRCLLQHLPASSFLLQLRSLGEDGLCSCRSRWRRTGCVVANFCYRPQL